MEVQDTEAAEQTSNATFAEYANENLGLLEQMLDKLLNFGNALAQTGTETAQVMRETYYDISNSTIGGSQLFTTLVDWSYAIVRHKYDMREPTYPEKMAFWATATALDYYNVGDKLMSYLDPRSLITSIKECLSLVYGAIEEFAKYMNKAHDLGITVFGEAEMSKIGPYYNFMRSLFSVANQNLKKANAYLDANLSPARVRRAGYTVQKMVVDAGGLIRLVNTRVSEVQEGTTDVFSAGRDIYQSAGAVLAANSREGVSSVMIATDDGIRVVTPTGGRKTRYDHGMQLQLDAALRTALTQQIEDTRAARRMLTSNTTRTFLVAEGY